MQEGQNVEYGYFDQQKAVVDDADETKFAYIR